MTLSFSTSYLSVRVNDDDGVTLTIRDSFLCRIEPPLWKKWKRRLWAGICFLGGGVLL